MNTSSDLQQTLEWTTRETEELMRLALEDDNSGLYLYLSHVHSMLAALRVFNEDTRAQITRLQEALGTIEPEERDADVYLFRHSNT